MELRHTLLFLALSLASAGLFAQPELAHWPHDRSSEASISFSEKDLARRTCVQPEFRVVSGESLVINTDPMGSFRQNTLLSPLSNATRQLVVQGDTLIYSAAANLIGVRDTLRFESCTDTSAASCSMREIEVLISRGGRRQSQTIQLTGGIDTVVTAIVPPGELACGEIFEIGFYEYSRGRAFDYRDYQLDSLFRYFSSRGPGDDAFLVVLCDSFGTCDSTDFVFSVSGPRSELPFIDDFSYRGPYPDPQLWIEDEVFVNDAFGIRAPSYGVASFDGVDLGGRSYGEGFGEVDQLTTAQLDLSGLTVDDDVYLKYFVQLGGRGQAPERQDLWLTQLRMADGAWVTVRSRTGSRTSTPDSNFVFVAVPIDSAVYFHRDFQVRFAMRANSGGSFDTWNLDYVVIEAQSDSNATFRDIALAERPPYLFDKYTALPYSQFRAAPDLLINQHNVELFNHFDGIRNLANSAWVVTDSFGIELANASLLTVQQLILERGYSIIRPQIPAPIRADLLTNVQSLSEPAAGEIRLSYELVNDRQQLPFRAFERNDTASTITRIGDVYAYDDGTAELGLFLRRAGNRMVLRYEAFAADTLRGLQFRFPNFSPADANRQLINLQVYIGELGDIDRAPDYEQILLRPFFPEGVRDTLQAFTTYRLEDEAGEPLALPIPVGSFYVGYQMATDAQNPVQIGVDVNRDNGAEIFTEFGSGWVPLLDPLPDFYGSLMIRPVFGDEPPQSTSSNTELTTQSWTLFPNPSAGTVFLKGADDIQMQVLSYDVFDMMGRRVQAGRLSQEGAISLDAAPGLYLLRLIDANGQQLSQHKVFIQH